MNQKILEAKESIVNEVAEKVTNSGSVTVVEYHGLSVAEITNLRRDLRNVDAEMVVLKNTMVSRATEKAGCSDLNSCLEGPNAYIFSKDVIAGPKIITKAAKRNEHLKIKGGIVEGKVVSADELKTIANLPGREGLISMFLSCLQAPVRGFACAVKAIADKQN